MKKKSSARKKAAGPTIVRLKGIKKIRISKKLFLSLTQQAKNVSSDIAPDGTILCESTTSMTKSTVESECRTVHCTDACEFPVQLSGSTLEIDDCQCPT